MATTCQLLLRGLDGRTSCLRFSSSVVTGSLIQDQIATVLRLPTEALLIVTGTTLVHPHTSLSASSDGFFPSCTLLARLRGGKGGFGSLLRGAATKAGQKKTSNFDACRDMSGRRLRHVNAEKKLKEWNAQAKERELEKAANEYLKKQVKKKEDDSGSSQVIEKFREDTSRARVEVESAVARGLAEAKRLGKRKAVEEDLLPASSSKRPNVWLNNGIDMIEELSEDERDSSDDDDEDDEEALEAVNAKEGFEDAIADEGFEAEKGCEDGKYEEVSEYVKAEGGLEAERGCQDGKPEKVFEYLKAEECFEVRSTRENTGELSGDVKAENWSVCEKADERLGEDDCNGSHTVHVEKNVHVVEVVNVDASSQIVPASLHGGAELGMFEGEDELVPCSDENGHLGTSDVSLLDNGQDAQEKLNLDDFLQASDLEVFGLQRLKDELQVRGLKCGGSLAERAGRLFLLKTIPLAKMDKKHFAKGKG